MYINEGKILMTPEMNNKLMQLANQHPDLFKDKNNIENTAIELLTQLLSTPYGKTQLCFILHLQK